MHKSPQKLETITEGRPDFLKLTEVIPKAILHAKRLSSNLEALKTKIAIQNVLLQKETNRLMLNTETLSVLLQNLPEIYKEECLEFWGEPQHQRVAGGDF